MLTDANIPQLLAQEGVSVLLLSAEWDGKGVILKAILQGVAKRHPEVNFHEADYEANPQLTRLFNLLTPPGLLFLRDGELIHRVTKPISAGRIQELIAAA